MTHEARRVLQEAKKLGPNDQVELLCQLFNCVPFESVDAVPSDVERELEDRRAVLSHAD